MPTVNFILVDLAYTPHPHETTQNCSESSLASMVRYKTTDRLHLYPDFFSSFCIYLMACSSPTQQNRSTISYPLFQSFLKNIGCPRVDCLHISASLSSSGVVLGFQISFLTPVSLYFPLAGAAKSPLYFYCSFPLLTFPSSSIALVLINQESWLISFPSLLLVTSIQVYTILPLLLTPLK